MKIYLAGTASHELLTKKYKPKYILESYYYIKDWQIDIINEDFMLDSGAFSFMADAKKETDWYEYADKYADFIKSHNIMKYIELDLDYVIGVDASKQLRNILEKATNRQSIPVWHPIRGIENFKKMCDEYNYVALGGIVGKKWQGLEKYMPWFISEAHKRNAIIHGLGFTKTSAFDKVRFDSVDSTTWTIGGRMGNMCYFTGSGMRQYYPSLHKQKPKNINALTEHNLIEWIKFQQYADENL